MPHTNWRSELVACPLCSSEATQPWFASSGPKPSSTRLRYVRCLECHLVRLDPHTSQDDAHLFRAAVASPHILARLAQRVDAAIRVSNLQRAASLKTGSHVLDIGCGRPTFLRALRANCGCVATGVDDTDAGWSSHPNDWSDLRLIRGTIEDVPSSDRFDAVTLWQRLGTYADPMGVLRGARRRSRDGAVLWVETPDADSVAARLQAASWSTLVRPLSLVVFDARTLDRALRSAGWEVRAIQGGSSLGPHVLGMRGAFVHPRSGFPGRTSVGMLTAIGVAPA